jgi:hypothetical protein
VRLPRPASRPGGEEAAPRAGTAARPARDPIPGENLAHPSSSPDPDFFQALRAERPRPGEYHWEPCCFCGLPIRNSATEPCRLLLESGAGERARHLDEYWCHEACFRARTVLTGALAGVRRGEGGEILNAVDLTAEDVVGERVLCPGCRQTVFASWPEGWDAHAAHRCGGAEGTTRAARKAAFKRRFAYLFR